MLQAVSMHVHVPVLGHSGHALVKQKFGTTGSSRQVPRVQPDKPVGQSTEHFLLTARDMAYFARDNGCTRPSSGNPRLSIVRFERGALADDSASTCSPRDRTAGFL